MSTFGPPGAARPDEALAALLKLSGASTPFGDTSRYHRTTMTVVNGPGGQPVAVLRRRIVPGPESIATAGFHRVVEGDRPDLLAHQTLGDASQWWQLCDANGLMDAGQLAQPIGRTVRIGLPGGAG